MFLICSNFLTETCNATKKNVRLSTIKTHNFLSFILFLSSSARRQPLWGVLQKSILQLCSNQSKNTCKGVQFFIKVAGFKSATLLKLNSFTGISHRFWTQMQLYTLWISYFEEHIFKYFCRMSSVAASQYHINTINREYSKF